MAIVLGSRDWRINHEANIGLGQLTGEQAFARYFALGGCAPAQTITSQMPDTESDGTVTTLQDAGGCAPGGGARYYAIDGGGHTWPQGNYTGVSLLGKVAKDFNATDEIRAFFTRSEEHTYELQSLIRISYAVFCLKNKKLIKQ